jgi:hypothetical protein
MNVADFGAGAECCPAHQRMVQSGKDLSRCQQHHPSKLKDEDMPTASPDHHHRAPLVELATVWSRRMSRATSEYYQIMSS